MKNNIHYDIPGVTTFEFTKIVGLENIKFGKNIIIDDFVFIYAKKHIWIKDHVHIACFTSITGGEELEVGLYSGISQGCRILTGTDDFSGWGFGNPTIDEKYRNVKRAPIRIGSFCAIGANSVLLPGVTVGEGAAVGANSTVSRDIPPWSIYLHNKIIGMRDRAGVLKMVETFVSEKKGENR